MVNEESDFKIMLDAMEKGEPAFIPKSTTPGDPDMLDPDMTLTCLWCGKEHNPYNHLVLHDYAYFSFCCDKHYFLYRKYGKLKDFIDNIPRYLIWKPYFAIQHWWYRLECPSCHKRMRCLLAKQLYFCLDDSCEYNCVTFEVEWKPEPIDGVRYRAKVTRIL